MSINDANYVGEYIIITPILTLSIFSKILHCNSAGLLHGRYYKIQEITNIYNFTSKIILLYLVNIDYYLVSRVAVLYE